LETANTNLVIYDHDYLIERLREKTDNNNSYDLMTLIGHLSYISKEINPH